MSDKPQILLEPQNPLDVTPEALQSLADEMGKLTNDADFHVAYFDQPPGTAGITWPEVITIWVGLPFSSAIIHQLVQVSVDWMKRRFADQSRTSRPKCIQVARYDGESGKLIEIIEITELDKRPVYRLPSEWEQSTRTVPPRRDTN